MRFSAVSALLLAFPLAALAQGGPTQIGEFDAWTAATHVESGAKVCYAFTRARSAEGVSGRQARDVMLLVTHRPNGRDQVAARPGYGYPRNAEPQVFVGATELPFYAASDTAFARDGRAAVAAFRAGREALLRGPGPNNRGQAADTFSLSGFTAAHEAISRECPAQQRR